MNKTTKELTQQILSRVDALASKLGIAAEHVWKFTVTAKVVDAKRALVSNVALLILPAAFLGWSTHVARMHVQHEVKHEITGWNSKTYPVQCPTANGYVIWNSDASGWHATPPPAPKHTQPAQVCEQVEQTPIVVDKEGDITGIGWAYLVSGLITLILGLFIGSIAVDNVVDAVASLHTAEYDAYRSLLYDLKD